MKLEELLPVVVLFPYFHSLLSWLQCIKDKAKSLQLATILSMSVLNRIMDRDVLPQVVPGDQTLHVYVELMPQRHDLLVQLLHPAAKNREQKRSLTPFCMEPTDKASTLCAVIL